jgi:hypothetical protein
MALTAVNIETLSRERAPIDWATVQFAQFEHDEKYHREISRLTVQDRLRHMTMHFAKYVGKLHAAPNVDQFRRVATDTLIIAVSCANILNVDLRSTPLAADGGGASQPAFTKRLAVCTGRMAEACEKLDHLEDFPFRKAIVKEVLAILAASLDVFSAEGWNPVEEMQERLAPVKAKSIFHGRL